MSRHEAIHYQHIRNLVHEIRMLHRNQVKESTLHNTGMFKGFENLWDSDYEKIHDSCGNDKNLAEIYLIAVKYI